MKLTLFTHLPNKRLIYLLVSIVVFLGINPLFHQSGQAWMSVLISWISRIEPSELLIATRYLLAVAFYGFAVYLVLHNIHKREVTVDVILGSISAYLLIGIMWAYLYQFINLLTPGSFLSTIASETGTGTIDYFYYSYVTLTTLGFGDIVPVSSAARSFTALEAITGVLFTAVVIARVIGLYVAKKGGVIGDVVDAIKK